MSRQPRWLALRSRWQAGGITIGTSIALPSPLAAEALSHLGFDCLTVDMQHGALDDGDMQRLLLAMAGSECVPFVRVPWCEPAAIMRALDAGALGLFCPLIETVEQARRFVGACFYAPSGYRSIGPLHAAARYGADYVDAVAPHVLPFAMIESRAGLESAQAIAAVEGLAGLYVGTSDLSLDMGFGPRFDPGQPEMAEALRRIEAAARAAGKIPAIHVVEPAHVAPMAALGYRHILLGNDLRLLLQGAGAALTALRDAARP